jgi:cytidylate kinase
VIVTVSRAYGAAALAVCRQVAERLGYRLVNEELPVVVAARLGTSTEIVETVSQRPRSFGERVLAQLGGAVPETAQPSTATDHDLLSATRHQIEEIVREVATEGNAVIIGRMAGTILRDWPGVLRVFLHAPLPWRIAHVMESLHCDEPAARAEIARIDEARRTYAKEQYRVNWGEARNYDLVIDTARFGISGTADVIVAAVRVAGA